jgi:hypothetical protein
MMNKLRSAHPVEAAGVKDVQRVAFPTGLRGR